MAKNPYDETYDRRRLASRAHAVELRDRGFDKIVDPKLTYDVPEVRYKNVVLEPVPVCNSPFCWGQVTTRLGFGEQGVDAFVGPVPVGPGRFVYVAELPAGQHVCGECGKEFETEK